MCFQKSKIGLRVHDFHSFLLDTCTTMRYLNKKTCKFFVLFIAQIIEKVPVLTSSGIGCFLSLAFCTTLPRCPLGKYSITMTIYIEDSLKKIPTLTEWALTNITQKKLSFLERSKCNCIENNLNLYIIWIKERYIYPMFKIASAYLFLPCDKELFVSWDVRMV